MLGAEATGFKNRQGKASLSYELAEGSECELEAERVLIALGRKPDLEELSLENAGVITSPKGIVADKTLRTTAPNIYACGDVVGPDQLATMAEYQGIIAATNAVLPVKKKVDYRNGVYVIFTDPTLAYIGLTEAQARAKYGHKLKVYRFDYANMRRALIDGATKGLGKFLCDGRGRLIGAHILGEAAAEVIHEAQVIKALKKPSAQAQSRDTCLSHICSGAFGPGRPARISRQDGDQLLREDSPPNRTGPRKQTESCERPPCRRKAAAD
jgi:pyruvate/2-oxoglutarate dehydrogenase complex dihydrolipoamide dehydrogenase (E3) component